MLTLQDYRERLQRGYEYVIIPTEVLDINIPLDDMLKSESPDTYWTLNELSAALGNAFTPVQIIDSRFVVFHWGFDKGLLTGEEKKEKKFYNLIDSAGYVDMRDNLVTVEEIDFDNLTGNEFGIFSSWEISKV